MSNDSADVCRAWLQEDGRKSTWLAAQLGVDPTLVSHWLAGRRRPAPEQAQAIQRLSDGVVPADGWGG